MDYLLTTLNSKLEVDKIIKETKDVVLVLRFGKACDSVCMHLDNLMSKCSAELANMAVMYAVDVDKVPMYCQYFDISLIPATIFFFNAQHIKVDWETPDHSKFIGTFKKKQHIIDVVETIYRGAMKGKLMVNSPLDKSNVQKYQLLYKDI